MLTAVTSSNFGLRSISRDTELGAFVLTTDPPLRAALRDEASRLLRFSEPAAPPPPAGAAMRVLRPLLRSLL